LETSNLELLTLIKFSSSKFDLKVSVQGKPPFAPSRAALAWAFEQAARRYRVWPSSECGAEKRSFKKRPHPQLATGEALRLPVPSPDEG